MSLAFNLETAAAPGWLVGEVRTQLEHHGEGLRGRERQVAQGQAGAAQWPSQPGILLLDVWHLC